jgi:hypothetical protein
MTSDRIRHHMLGMIETMQREGRDEAEIVRAVEGARGESNRTEDPLSDTCCCQALSG